MLQAKHDKYGGEQGYNDQIIAREKARRLESVENDPAKRQERLEDLAATLKDTEAEAVEQALADSGLSDAEVTNILNALRDPEAQAAAVEKASQALEGYVELPKDYPAELGGGGWRQITLEILDRTKVSVFTKAGKLKNRVLKVLGGQKKTIHTPQGERKVREVLAELELERLIALGAMEDLRNQAGEGIRASGPAAAVKATSPTQGGQIEPSAQAEIPALGLTKADRSALEGWRNGSRDETKARYAQWEAGKAMLLRAGSTLQQLQAKAEAVADEILRVKAHRDDAGHEILSRLARQAARGTAALAAALSKAGAP